MERSSSSPSLLLPLLVLISSWLLLLSCHGANAYKNYTVGDFLGWYDNLQEPKANYQKWAAGKNFSLGDFLFFNTDKNHSVVQTYNATTYKHCNYNDADAEDTIEWSAGEPEVTNEAVSVAVPLVKEGMNYFFSGNYDGEQCKHGQHFKINVTHGQGLPESLKNPVPDAPVPTSPEDGETVPDTVIPSNFDKPTDTGDEKATSGAADVVKGKAPVAALLVMGILLVIIA